MKKNERIKQIESLLIAREIKTQDDLVNALLALGIEVTQATVSRDMRDLRLIKVPAKMGGYRYALPETSRQNADIELLSSEIETIKIQGNQLAVKTRPGSAMILKNRLIRRFEQLIFTVLSDDDTVLLIANSDENAVKIHENLTN
ncbi:arginine repressor [Lactococcus hodotermopsidis]|uniref:Arginine repressor n=1 Tax=Pseudolactococcus hodotermopsidis TaxID=2709157 RepID=A0A6A0BA98_9LACT|nr:transcriptional regulator [Lactococcus hodotermopsidis]GFH41716.1 arginine repressor [Lactococcus hodotermopsidis]